MAKRRRKLSKDYEKEISKSTRDVELILAKINDINEDDIRVCDAAFDCIMEDINYDCYLEDN